MMGAESELVERVLPKDQLKMTREAKDRAKTKMKTLMEQEAMKLVDFLHGDRKNLA